MSASDSDVPAAVLAREHAGKPADDGKVKVLVVCLGNICRSPLAEAVLKHTADQRGLGDTVEVDSAGTAAYHTGEEPDVRTVQICKENKIPIDHLARAIKPRDFFDFHYILAADRQNLSNLTRMKPKGATAIVKLFGEYGDGKVIDDPYYGGMHGFQKAYDQCLSYSHGFLDAVLGPRSAS
ncbi:Low molecular weight phosphotyrosine protein phosphatase-like protein [Calocera viscosa TUFC12733]|uniref:Low molecular weight phosphotyrosine protein phosphatase-like protein n=1 Tax=Calocera viscosa (strain TUFC12733) TaxID=1330018 RepID=A0A167R9S1_CALVF|nr:Low molecular weight phosphotyrosine protein phosphatase-like protein [Calocera viscosa TUFC12733]